MIGFDTFVMVDWSGGNDRGPTPCADAIWIGEAGASPLYRRNRQVAEAWLLERIDHALTAGERLCLGFDFPFGYPAGFAEALTGKRDPFALWRWMSERVEDQPKSNNRFDVAGEINQRFGGRGPFWANALKRDVPGLPRTKRAYHNPFPERRAVEHLAKGSFTCWQLAGAGAVGSQVIMGLPVLSRLRAAFPDHVAVWPFQELNKRITLVEIWPSLTVGKAPDGWIKDAWQVAEVSKSLAECSPQDLLGHLSVTAPEEGWILGVPQAKPVAA